MAAAERNLFRRESVGECVRVGGGETERGRQRDREKKGKSQWVCFDNAPTKHQRAKKKNRDAAYESVFGVYQTEKEEEGWAHTREQLGPPSLPPSLSRFPSQRLNSHTPEEMEDREREREREREIEERERSLAMCLMMITPSSSEPPPTQIKKTPPFPTPPYNRSGVKHREGR